jgi:hypothetical protein
VSSPVVDEEEEDDDEYLDEDDDGDETDEKMSISDFSNDDEFAQFHD